ncbi:aquaporin [Bifidobacterium sp. ESL0745]|uniref:MIP/aquaporin family protein n=1 Tax=Bifidobacterium sp. ESL0745 TaxID=2983226 RepID=UPI0023F8F91D|nr:aquaporin [Bifidobacterium sp. ESL0745]MDF7665047.1 aquaporin [Bifidobacterium sp. ESL0745]
MTEQQAQHTESKTAAPIPISAIGGELVGSFLIFLVIYLVSALSPSLYGPSAILIAAATGLAYAAMTFIFGKFSGGQFNPAVTLSAMLVGKTGVVNGICYILAQVVGGIVAGGVVKLVLPTSKAAPAKMWFTNAVNGYDQGSISSAQLQQAGVSFGILFAVIVEVIATIIVVAASLYALDDDGKATSKAPAIMGIAYALGVTFTYPITGASLNPARATGIALFASQAGLAANPLKQLWIFWICPILAAAIVAIVVIIAQMVSSNKPAQVEGVDVTESWDKQDSESDDDTNDDSEPADDSQTATISESVTYSATGDDSQSMFGSSDEQSTTDQDTTK